jgi:hypothetical protein
MVSRLDGLSFMMIVYRELKVAVDSKGMKIEIHALRQIRLDRPEPFDRRVSAEIGIKQWR